ncbi:hypothetical protein L9W92_08305 [Pelotomaculum terephthalicicum JT]|uniref:hypothetical protein n=1 Tax=Pelotomaculum TaxID=191373 RepID=UPI0009D33867|nr:MULTISPECIES: hypothetical protein [Pelotomaculum]MCG9968049.1 hypothetical protein [Pelotomaculum terephthalicicum JT]OPX85654.1 MAG: hypothetical protein A4E54_02354 [Pelotomaculum sp. PtaB.Bin117]OPY63974.1 MAG: hypothetical protein A4E56_00026 [Pelotomaculum sp. PtaU1.Bin065]
MRKIVLLAMALILSTALSSTAFASQSRDRGTHNDSKISHSSHSNYGYSWYKIKAVSYAKNHYDYYQKRIAQLERILHQYNTRNLRSHWNYDRDFERYFYVDDNGVSHYFYLDPDKDYIVHQYKDSNGITQYWFEDAGWK